VADSTPQTLAVSILDREYRINCPADSQAELQQAAKFLDDKMREIRQASNNSGKVLAADRIAVIAALNIAHQLQESERAQAQVADDLRRIDERLEETLQQDMQLEL
jgi:cell division protein ZapA